MMLTPVFLDFEASSLASGSYPIEVAWSDADACIESHLISPAGITTWTDWSSSAQQLHGLTREQLLTSGKSPMWVARRMNEQLSGQMAYTDNPDYDGFWLEQLFKKTNGLKPAFSLGHVDDLLMSLICPELSNAAYAKHLIETMKSMARQMVSGQHRAASDVQYLIQLYTLANSE